MRRNKGVRIRNSGHGEVAVEKGSENVFEEFGAAGGVGVVAFEICGFHPCPGEEAWWNVVGEKLRSDAFFESGEEGFVADYCADDVEDDVFFGHDWWWWWWRGRLDLLTAGFSGLDVLVVGILEVQ